jgi:biopolymer transport protein ExbD
MNHSDGSRKEVARSGVRDLRTRYVPRARIRPIYLQAGPWLDLLFLLFFLTLAQARIVLKPGVVVSLPLHGGGGVVSGLTAVLVPGKWNMEESATVYFNDEAFALHDTARVESLMASLQQARKEQSIEEITLYTDSRVSHAYVVQVMDMIADVGFDQLNIGTSPHSTETTVP